MLKEILCGLRKRHDFIMEKMEVFRYPYDGWSGWEADNTYCLKCINCGAVYLGAIKEPDKK